LFERVLGESSDFMKRLNNREVLGEAEHPESGNTHIGRVSHMWEKIWPDWNTGRIMGECIILRTPEGQKLEELIEVGHPLGFSSRGRGEVTSRPDGIEEVKVEDYLLDTFDAVAKPSVAIARMDQATTGEGVVTRPGVVRTESREEIAPMNQTAVFPAAQMLARAESTMNGVSESLTKRQDASSLVEAQAQIAGLMAEMAAYPAPNELREQYAETRGRLREASTGIVNKLKTLKKGRKRGKSGLTGGRNKAASDLIEALMERNRQLRDGLTESSRPVIDDSRYEVSVQLGEELLRRARTLQEERDEYRQQRDAAVELVEAVVRKTKGSKTQGRLREAFKDPLIRNNKRARKLLENCRSTQEVDQAVRLIHELVGTRPTAKVREKLPPLGGQQRQQLSESQQQPQKGFPQKKRGQRNTFGESLMGQMAKREARMKSDILAG